MWQWWFIYPTYYHFVASIIVLYIPYYFVVSNEFFKDRIDKIIIIVGIISVCVYVLLYDKTYYHIDTVREPFIRFLFFESMLLGAFFKIRKNGEANKNKMKNYCYFGITFVGYFASKLLFSRVEAISNFQLLNQFIIFALLYFTFTIATSHKEALDTMPNLLKHVIEFISKITLEIYIVQYVIIDVLRPIFSFPMNWFVITFAIIIAAYALHILCKQIYWLVDCLLKIRKK